MKNLTYILSFILLTLVACTDDESFSTSRSNLLTFATDTVQMDTVFSRVPAPTKSFWIYNKSGDGIRCSQIKLEKGNQTGFRVNVDGDFLSAERGYQINDVEIRKGDSIRVFVEVTTPNQGQIDPKFVEDNLVFNLESGISQKVNLNVWSWDAEKISNLRVTDTRHITAERPVVVYGGITVDSTATLILDPGATLYFHGNAGMDVYGKLLSQGTAEQPVTLRGDRLDHMFDYLPYDLVSGQWKGIHFNSSSMDNELTFTDIHSTYDGVVCDSSSLDALKLNIANSTIHNCQGYGLKADHSVIGIAGAQISNTLNDCIYVNGGYTEMSNCTVAQFYPFDSRRGVALRFSDEMNNAKAVSYVGTNGITCANTIITGFADDVIMGEMNDTTGTYSYYFDSDVLRTPKIEDEKHFANIIWEKELEDSIAKVNKNSTKELADSTTTGEKMFVLVSHDTQHYDFHLDTHSCAIGKASSEWLIPTDRDGKPFLPQKPDIGCFRFEPINQKY